MDKKLAIISLAAGIVIVVFGLIGLKNQMEGAKKEVSESLMEAVDRTETEAKKQYKASAEDDMFWSSIEKTATLVSGSVEGEHEYHVIFELETSAGKVFAIEQHQIAGDINQLWRDLCKSQIMVELASLEEVDKAHLAGESVRVTCTTLLSPDYKEDGSGQGVLELCDTDGDGAWDVQRYNNQ
ncbi:hypothetical protein IKE82_02655 [Candidatus Saccharibacteria bacterium]|nr:hypothetical protein [Candidatus Saccharibacteria bacterium]